jgi:hypothetical protein
MGRIGISEKEPRRTEGLVRVNSKDLKVVDAASLLGPLCQVLMNTIIETWPKSYRREIPRSDKTTFLATWDRFRENGR